MLCALAAYIHINMYIGIDSYCSSTRRPTLQRHLAAKLLLICNIEKMTEKVVPSICQKIINLQPLLCSSLKKSTDVSVALRV
jgi:hypothetical protein